MEVTAILTMMGFFCLVLIGAFSLLGGVLILGPLLLLANWVLVGLLLFSYQRRHETEDY